MAYPTAAEFRPDTLVEYTLGLAIALDEANATVLQAAIDAQAQSFEEKTNDTFVTTGSTTITIDGTASRKLILPKRCTAVTVVKTVDYAGTETTQAAGTYRLHSSLDAAGAERVGSYDFIEILPESAGFVNTRHPYKYDQGVATVKVTGVFGWTTTPRNAKRAVALMVWDQVKPRRADLHKVARIDGQSESIVFTDTEPTGIVEADRIIAEFYREPFMGFG